jgi:hypothetical protein
MQKMIPSFVFNKIANSDKMEKRLLKSMKIVIITLTPGFFSQETDRLLGQQYNDDNGYYESKVRSG